MTLKFERATVHDLEQARMPARRRPFAHVALLLLAPRPHDDLDTERPFLLERAGAHDYRRGRLEPWCRPLPRPTSPLAKQGRLNFLSLIPPAGCSRWSEWSNGMAHALLASVRGKYFPGLWSSLMIAAMSLRVWLEPWGATIGEQHRERA